MAIKQKKIYFTFGTFICLLLVSVFIVYPSIKEIKKISNQINEQKEKLEKFYMEGCFLKPTKNQYEKIEPQIAELSKIFIHENQELDLITNLENIASKNNLKQKIELKELKEDTKTQAKYETLPLTIKIIGNYLNCIKYLIELEALNFYINIDEIKAFSFGTGGFKTEGISSINKNDVSILINAHAFKIQNYEISED